MYRKIYVYNTVDNSGVHRGEVIPFPNTLEQMQEEGNLQTME